MTELKKKWYFIPIMVLTFLLAIFCVLTSIQILVSTEGTVYLKLATSFALLALLAGILYILMGAKKNAAMAYKTFLAFYAVAVFFCLINGIMNSLENPSDMILSLTVNMIVFGVILILFEGKDLGKSISYLLCGIIVVLRVLLLVGYMVKYPGSFEGEAIFKTFNSLLHVTQLVIALITAFITFGKYADKAARGRKA